MKFSVLIAHYNNSVYFKDCYESLKNQTYPNWEAVILDDASKDSEKKAVIELIQNDSRFKFYENEENSGVGITKSKLIELASGEICGFVDPDDALLPSAIQKAIDIFRNNQDVVLAYSRFVSCDQNMKPLSEFKSAMQIPNNDRFFFNYPVQIAHFVSFRKKTYELTEKMNSSLKISEDQDLYLKLYEKGKVKFIDEANYLYRTHPKGISQNENKKESYEYWGHVIFNAMKRRHISHINGKKIPESYTNSTEIFSLLSYQNKIFYRIVKKLKILFQKI
ncbi:glycosyltransferase family 2 protein [Chryseobacterium echinoideorum]|uniref:glycosyltransferase family 2 protein n=1 Tax=Chryseobacterium echinoideorum TaxID=1549648 RepID=UPI001186B285|nr:glycosyltransferase family 2 protein [Chryseobacterium echinoideorum]